VLSVLTLPGGLALRGLLRVPSHVHRLIGRRKEDYTRRVVSDRLALDAEDPRTRRLS
jgi:hypothetical protein